MNCPDCESNNHCPLHDPYGPDPTDSDYRPSLSVLNEDAGLQMYDMDGLITVTTTEVLVRLSTAFHTYMQYEEEGND